MSALSVSVMSWRRFDESPTLSGGEVGSGSAIAGRETKKPSRSAESPRRRLMARFPYGNLVDWGEPATAQPPAQRPHLAAAATGRAHDPPRAASILRNPTTPRRLDLPSRALVG